MAVTEKRKQSLYFSDDMLTEIMREAIRLDRSLSWMVQRAWCIAAEVVSTFPSVSAGDAAPRVLRVGDQPAPAAEAPAPAAAPERQAGSQVLDFIRGKFDRKPTPA